MRACGTLLPRVHWARSRVCGAQHACLAREALCFPPLHPLLLQVCQALGHFDLERHLHKHRQSGRHSRKLSTIVRVGKDVPMQGSLRGEEAA